MNDRKEYIGYRLIESALAALLILFAISYFNNRESNFPATGKHNISHEIVLSLENAVVSTVTQVTPANNQELSKIRYPENRLTCKIISENRKIDFLITLQENRVSEKVIPAINIYCRHLFPPEKEDVPLAG